MKKNTFQDRLSDSLRQHTDRIAVQYRDQFLTYSLVDRRSDDIAGRIIARGIEKETFIGVLIDDRMDFIVTIIGILKANGVFLPLESQLPDNRLDMMLRCTDTRVVIGDKQNRSRLNRMAESPLVEFILIDDLVAPAENSGPDFEPPRQSSPEDKIYIFFTSGTSGTPKAIVGKNKSLLHFIDWEIEAFGVDHSYRFSQFIHPCFDAFLRDIFVPLCAGAGICIPPQAQPIPAPQQLREWIDRHKINLIHCVPSLFRVFNAGVLKEENFRQLKYVLLSGEKLDPAELVQWYRTFAERIQLVNLYGPTETTMIKTYYFIRPTDVDKERLPVGTPMKGVRVIILDKNMQICPANMIGEIYIRTPYRTYGYYNDPQANQEVFIPNPFTGEPNDLFYKTGDRGTILEDGNIILLGRLDRQVKINGIRVELEEIENVILKYPAVEEAVVIKKKIPSKGIPDKELLVAYITLKEKSRSLDKPGFIDLETYLTGILPPYLLPARIIGIEKIPRKSNGKIDYNLLPDPLSENQSDNTPPKNSIERKLHEIWSDILNVKKIGVKSNYFESGGSSLNIMTMLARIQKEFGIEIPWEQIIENPTIEKLARLLETGVFKGDHEKPYVVLNELKPVTIFCFPPQVGYGMIFNRLADFLKNYTLYAFHFIEADDRLEKYVDIITGIQFKGPYLLMGYSAGGNLAFEVAKEMGKKGLHISDIIMLDTFRKNGKIRSDSKDDGEDFYQDLERAIASLGLEHLKEKVITKAKKYKKYLDNLENQGRVKAYIHLITSINREEIEKQYSPSPSTGTTNATRTSDTSADTDWGGLSDNTTTYNGFGSHSEMMSTACIEKNAAIIQSIITPLENALSQ